MADEAGWYDRGGFLSPSATWVRNDSGESIVIKTAEQIRDGLRYMRERYGKPEPSDD